VPILETSVRIVKDAMLHCLALPTVLISNYPLCFDLYCAATFAMDSLLSVSFPAITMMLGVVVPPSLVVSLPSLTVQRWRSDCVIRDVTPFSLVLAQIC
jgi:hypothetical protein